MSDGATVTPVQKNGATNDEAGIEPVGVSVPSTRARGSGWSRPDTRCAPSFGAYAWTVETPAQG